MGGMKDLSDVLYLYRQGEFNWMRLKTMVYPWNGIVYRTSPIWGGPGAVSAEEMGV